MDDEFELPDGSYSIAQMQNYFECIIKKHVTVADNSLIQIYINRIKKRLLLR